MPEERKIRRILSIDGGGIKGVVPAAFLASVEESSGKKIADHFDMIAGTSAGGIIALGIGLGFSAKRILEFLCDRGPVIFEQPTGKPGKFRECLRYMKWIRKTKYDSKELEAELVKEFGERTLGESLTRLVIPAYHRDLQELHVFKTAHHHRFEKDRHESAVNVALATAAAPAFFPAHEMPSGSNLIDGGVWANNPVGVAVVEAIGVMGWNAADLRVLSLGCVDEVSIFDTNSGLSGLGIYGEKIAGLLLQSQSRSAIGTARILTGHPHAGEKIWRHSPKVPTGTFSLDGAHDVERLAGLGNAQARSALPKLRSVFLGTPVEPFTPLHGARRSE